MKNFVNQLRIIAENHFDKFNVVVDEKTEGETIFKINLSRNIDATKITIYPKFIKKIIKNNFTIFERLYHGKKLYNTAIMVILSTINNFINSKDLIEDVINLSKERIKTEFDYLKKHAEFEILIKRFSEEVLPYKDRNKYIVQPNITIKYKLATIFSNILLKNFKDFIGYRY